MLRLHNIGLKTSADVLMAEAGTTLIHPTAANFKKMVLNGDWSLAVKSKFFIPSAKQNLFRGSIIVVSLLLLFLFYISTTTF